MSERPSQPLRDFIEAFRNLPPAAQTEPISHYDLYCAMLQILEGVEKLELSLGSRKSSGSVIGD